ncbi:Proteolipid membrane potential modulator [Rubripirellula obstinata]|uniref:Proteolipid membrane potential modulator n=1 Tax=Rubripirellula obstinata TaxID=406547 RepID=A0A5B1CK16_9BACT|nr:YqaE/Pmp3 family membrane protein [Rubripirellula obstinata]KAA1261458.1 Proteolipid membrane potential modulator [Rubripirellula obstinata]
MDFIRLLLVFLLPPAAVYLQFGIDRHFWISCGLTLLGFVPGVLYGIYVMASNRPGLSRLR